MKKNYFFLLLAAASFATSCSNDGVLDDAPSVNQVQSVSSLNRSGVVDGLSYSFKSVSINPELVIINSDKAVLESSAENLSSGIIKLTSVSESVSPLLKSGNILYIQIGDYTGLRKVDNVLSGNGNIYILETSQAQLGEVFQGGTIDLSLDLYEAAKVAEQKNPGLRSTYTKDYMYEIANITGSYNFGGIQYDPATNVKMMLNMKMAFAKTQLLPTEFSTVFELQTTINPSYKFAASVNKIHNEDLIKFIPQEVIDLIKKQEFDIKIPINMLGIETLPAKVKVQDINIPTQIEINLSKESSLSYGVNGSFKTGYIININGFKAKTTSVYENNIKANAAATEGIHGEILTQSDVVIAPNITILDGAYTVNGDISFGVKTISNGHIELPGKAPIFGTKGTFYSNMNVIVDLILMKIPVNIFNNEKTLWEVGNIDKTITYSDLRWNVTSAYTTNYFTGDRSYNTNFKINYKYPILGKMIPNKLLLSYDVYAKDGKTKLATVSNASITPFDVDTNSFGFQLSIPFKKEGRFIWITYQNISYLKNIVIKDENGYVYEGVLNTNKGIVENSFEIKR